MKPAPPHESFILPVSRGGRLVNKLYGLLDIPWIYRLSQNLLAPGKSLLMKRVFKRAFPHSRGLVLDVGCGPKLTTPPPEGRLVGVDINESYLRKYTGGFLDEDPRSSLQPGSRDRMGFLAPADNLPFAEGTFDEARATGFLHHLTDDQLTGTIREMRRCLKKGGRLIVLEDVWPIRAWTRPLAWLIRRLDRGDYMRTQEELVRLFQDACPEPWECGRYTYTFTGTELLYMCLEKK